MTDAVMPRKRILSMQRREHEAERRSLRYDPDASQYPCHDDTQRGVFEMVQSALRQSHLINDNTRPKAERSERAEDDASGAHAITRCCHHRPSLSTGCLL